MARYRVYFKPFKRDGSYQDDWIEVTSDVSSLGSIQRAIENSEFDVGVFKNSSVSLTLRNDKGYYSEPDALRSIFRYKRRGVLCKVTWDVRDYDLVCGFFKCGHEPLGGEMEIFRGLISDVASAGNITQQDMSFTVLGIESLIDEIEVPYDQISDGDLISEVLYACLNQSPLSSLVSVTEANIAPLTDVEIDDKSGFENSVIGDILPDLLVASGSVLSIKNDALYVGPRTPGASVKHTFYGQASGAGIEDVVDIPNYKDGVSRMFNYWTWTDTAKLSFDSSSVDQYGIRKKEIQLDAVTDETSIQSILDANKNEFSFPKTELDLVTPVSYQALALDLLDRVNIDYPTVYSPYDSNPLPRYGQAAYGQARYPYGQWSLTIVPTMNFKILGRKIDTAKQMITFSLREI
jgi:hypothetical protein